jgi:hypothetical protein
LPVVAFVMSGAQSATAVSDADVMKVPASCE